MLVAKQFDSIAADYDFMASLIHDNNFFLSNLPKHRKRCLDIGCGSGRLSVQLSSHFDEIIGIDISKGLLAIGREVTTKNGLGNVLLCSMDAEELGFSDGSFDCVVSHTTFHHVDVVRVLKQVKQLLRPRGRLLLVDVVARGRNKTPQHYVYMVGALLDLFPNVKKFSWTNAFKLYRFHTNPAWLDHVSQDVYLRPKEFEQLYSQELPGCSIENKRLFMSVIWDKT